MIAEYNEILNKKGIFLTVLQIGGERAMVYVYRKSHLKRDLKKPCVQCILRRFGYSDFTVTAAINVLKVHLKSFDEFPHEIGLFWAILLKMLPVSLKTKGVILFIAAAGRFIATNVKRLKPLPNIKNAGRCTAVCGRRALEQCGN